MLNTNSQLVTEIQIIQQEIVNLKTIEHKFYEINRNRHFDQDEFDTELNNSLSLLKLNLNAFNITSYKDKLNMHTDKIQYT